MDYFGRPNTQFNQYGNTPYMGNYQPQMAQQTQPAQMRTNKIFVTSLEDALNRYAEPNTIMIYRHQDENFEYEIITDGQGRKSYKTLELINFSQKKEENRPIILREEIDNIKGRLDSLESELLKKYKDDKRKEVNDEKSR